MFRFTNKLFQSNGLNEGHKSGKYLIIRQINEVSGLCLLKQSKWKIEIVMVLANGFILFCFVLVWNIDLFVRIETTKPTVNMEMN